jgi:hypothetical protein
MLLCIAPGLQQREPRPWFGAVDSNAMVVVVDDEETEIEEGGDVVFGDTAAQKEGYVVVRAASLDAQRCAIERLFPDATDIWGPTPRMSAADAILRPLIERAYWVELAALALTGDLSRILVLPVDADAGGWGGTGWAVQEATLESVVARQHATVRARATGDRERTLGHYQPLVTLDLFRDTAAVPAAYMARVALAHRVQALGGGGANRCVVTPHLERLVFDLTPAADDSPFAALAMREDWLPEHVLLWAGMTGALSLLEAGAVVLKLAQQPEGFAAVLRGWLFQLLYTCHAVARAGTDLRDVFFPGMDATRQLGFVPTLGSPYDGWHWLYRVADADAPLFRLQHGRDQAGLMLCVQLRPPTWRDGVRAMPLGPDVAPLQDTPGFLAATAALVSLLAEVTDGERGARLLAWKEELAAIDANNVATPDAQARLLARYLLEEPLLDELRLSVSDVHADPPGRVGDMLVGSESPGDRLVLTSYQ